MTDKSKGRRQTDARARYRHMADHADLGTVSRAHLAVLAKDLPQTGLVNSTEALLLVTLVSSAPTEQFSAGGMPIVFKSNRTLAFEIAKSPNHTGMLLSRLFDKGLVAMRDSANYKRFATRGDDGELLGGAGIDLRVLVARYGELSALVQTARAERKARDVAWSNYRGAVRQLHLVLSGAEDLASRILASLRSRFETILANATRRSSAASIVQATRLCRWLAERAYGLSRGRIEQSTLDKIMSSPPENREHLQTTNLNQSVSCSEDARRPANAGQATLNGAGSARRAWDERGGGEKSGTTGTPEANLDLSASTIILACPALTRWFGDAPTSWPALIEKYPLMCVLAGISPDARDRAAQTLGLKGAATAAALILERLDAKEIKSAGGFLRALTDRALQGKLNLEKSIYARARKHFA